MWLRGKRWAMMMMMNSIRDSVGLAADMRSYICMSNVYVHTSSSNPLNMYRLFASYVDSGNYLVPRRLVVHRNCKPTLRNAVYHGSATDICLGTALGALFFFFEYAVFFACGLGDRCDFFPLQWERNYHEIVHHVMI